MMTCCPAWRAWRAGVSIEDAGLVYAIGCDGERLEECRKAWGIKERIDLYNAQSDQALEGDSKLLQHLGRAVLNQGEPVTEDPGIGELVFVLPPVAQPQEGAQNARQGDIVTQPEQTPSQKQKA